MKSVSINTETYNMTGQVNKGLDDQYTRPPVPRKMQYAHTP